MKTNEQQDAELLEQITNRLAQAERFLVLMTQKIEWSERTFGPGRRTIGLAKHIRKELQEVEAAPDDLEEWIDVALLALDGAWRTGATAEQVLAALEAKQAKIQLRTYPKTPETEASEHLRDGEKPATKEQPHTNATILAADIVRRMAEMRHDSPANNEMLVANLIAPAIAEARRIGRQSLVDALVAAIDGKTEPKP